ncbi:MAG: carbohydrate kinase, partial [Burkholderiales bacterium]|nr:carbohydrate kinase [Anaerolineae bacterium]
MKASGPFLLGIDNGTSFVKSVAFDLSGREIAIARRETPVISLHPNWSEMDMRVSWSLCAETIAEVVAAVGAETIAAVGISGTACGVWAVDADLQPIRNAILWNDGRAAEIIAEWQSNGVTAHIFELSGNALFPGYPVAALRWLMAHEPQNFERIRWYLHHKDWLRLCLTGEIATEQADSSYFPGDIRGRGFSDELLDITGLSGFRDKLPEILRSHDVAGTITAPAAAQTGLRVGTPVIAGAVDVVVSTRGGGAFR